VSAERDAKWIERIAGQQIPAVVGRVRSRRGVLPTRPGTVVENVGKERYLVGQLIIAEQEAVVTLLLRHDVGELIEVVAIRGAVVAAVVIQGATGTLSQGDISATAARGATVNGRDRGRHLDVPGRHTARTGRLDHAVHQLMG